jgi:hypothetical protein
MFYIYIYASKYIFFMYYIKNAPKNASLPAIFENMCFPLPLRAFGLWCPYFSHLLDDWYAGQFSVFFPKDSSWQICSQDHDKIYPRV